MDSGPPAGPIRLPDMGQQKNRTVSVSLPAGICRRCVRALSRRISDLPGVVSLVFDAEAGVLRVDGELDPGELSRHGLQTHPEPRPGERRADDGDGRLVDPAERSAGPERQARGDRG